MKYQVIAENDKGFEMANEIFDTWEEAYHFQTTGCHEDWIMEIIDINE